MWFFLSPTGRGGRWASGEERVEADVVLPLPKGQRVGDELPVRRGRRPMWFFPLPSGERAG
jgi:hypothetical protein